MASPKWEHTVANLTVPAKPAGLWTLAVPYIPASSIVKVMASGTWNYAASGACGPDGARTAVGGLTQANCLCEDALVGSLIGKIGGGSADASGTVFGIGSHGIVQLTAEDKGGALFLGINDEIGGIDDNAGGLTVQVFVADAPPAPPAEES